MKMVMKIYVLSAKHDWGIAYLYVNDSLHYVLEETVDFELEGLHVADSDTD